MGDYKSRSAGRLRRVAFCIGRALLVAYAVHVLNALVGHRLDLLGIRPRSFVGLLGIPLHPFLHASLGHLLVNSLPFAVLGGLVAARGVGEWVEVSVFVILFEGAVLWLFGDSGSVYLGASRLIMGYFGYLVGRGWYERAPVSVAIAAVVVVVYGGLLFSVLPITTTASWLGHLLGLSGIGHDDDTAEGLVAAG